MKDDVDGWRYKSSGKWSSEANDTRSLFRKRRTARRKADDGLIIMAGARFRRRRLKGCMHCIEQCTTVLNPLFEYLSICFWFVFQIFSIFDVRLFAASNNLFLTFTVFIFNIRYLWPPCLFFLSFFFSSDFWIFNTQWYLFSPAIFTFDIRYSREAAKISKFLHAHKLELSSRSSDTFR